VTQRERQHSRDHRDGRHHDGTKSAARGREHRGVGRLAAPRLLLGVFDQQDSVFRDQTDQHDDAEHRVQIQRRVGDEERAESAN